MNIYAKIGMETTGYARSIDEARKSPRKSPGTNITASKEQGPLA